MVISKGIRDKLGVKPGWVALQRVVDDHVEIYFVMPEHNRSLSGSLAPYTKVSIGPGLEWDKARQMAWESAAMDKASLAEGGS